MKLGRAKAGLISDIAIDGNIDMLGYTLTNLGNLTLVKNTGVQLLAALSTDGDWSGNTVKSTCGEIIDKFETVYLKSDGKVWLAKADSDTTLPIKGIAVEDGAAEASISFLIKGFIRKDAWDWTIGALLYASDVTGGAIIATAPDTTNDMVQRIGIAVTADIIWFVPDLTMIKVKA